MISFKLRLTNQKEVVLQNIKITRVCKSGFLWWFQHEIVVTRFKIDLKKLLLFKLVSVVGIGGHKAKYHQTECQLGLLLGEDLVVKVISEPNEVASII